MHFLAINLLVLNMILCLIDVCDIKVVLMQNQSLMKKNDTTASKTIKNKTALANLAW